MNGLLSIVALGALAVSGYFLIRLIIAAIRKQPKDPYKKKLIVSVLVTIAAFWGVSATRSPEQIAAQNARNEERRLAKEKADEEKKLAEQKAAEEKRLAEEKAAEEKKFAEQKAAEEKRLAEEKAAEEKKLAEQKAAESKQRIAEKASELKRRVMEKDAELKRLAEQKAAEEKRLAEQKAAEEEARKQAEEERRRQEQEARILAEKDAFQNWESKINSGASAVDEHWENLWKYTLDSASNGSMGVQEVFQNLRELEHRLIDDEMIFQNATVPQEISQGYSKRMNTIKQGFAAWAKLRRKACETFRFAFVDGNPQGMQESLQIITQSDIILLQTQAELVALENEINNR